jgi:hypothetical protein
MNKSLIKLDIDRNLRKIRNTKKMKLNIEKKKRKNLIY